MKIEKIHIGSEIRKVVDQKFGNYSKFASVLGKSRQNVNAQIFLKPDLNTEMLVHISEILDFNFFELYRNTDTSVKENNDRPKIKVTLDLELTKEELKELHIEDKIKTLIR